MIDSLFEDIVLLNPEQVEKERQVKSQGFQHYRDWETDRKSTRLNSSH